MLRIPSALPKINNNPHENNKVKSSRKDFIIHRRKEQPRCFSLNRQDDVKTCNSIQTCSESQTIIQLNSNKSPLRLTKAVFCCLLLLFRSLFLFSSCQDKTVRTTTQPKVTQKIATSNVKTPSSPTASEGTELVNYIETMKILMED